MAIQHPDGWILTNQAIGGNGTDSNKPKKSEPASWVNAPATGNISNATINGNEIIAGTITADALVVKELSAITANIGTITAGGVGGWTINTTHIYSGATEPTAQISLDSSTPEIRVGGASGEERIELKDASISAYASDGTTKIYQFLNDATNNNVMTIWKVTDTPSYGNGINIQDTSTDDDASLNIEASGNGNATSKTLINAASNFTNATDIASIKSVTGAADTVLDVSNQAGSIGTAFNVWNAYAGGNSIWADNRSASNTDACVGIKDAGTGGALFIDKNNWNNCIEIDGDAAHANDLVGVQMNLSNTTGQEFAFAFDGSEYDSTSGGNTQVERIKVRVNGNTRYLYVYSN
jgi:hypothetical protein